MANFWDHRIGNPLGSIHFWGHLDAQSRQDFIAVRPNLHFQTLNAILNHKGQRPHPATTTPSQQLFFIDNTMT
jgi:hypothetical protein